tara:strand:- start:77 stop:655 length:579 start_codon:yes stop_codon:yes gene_type:complete
MEPKQENDTCNKSIAKGGMGDNSPDKKPRKQLTEEQKMIRNANLKRGRELAHEKRRKLEAEAKIKEADDLKPKIETKDIPKHEEPHEEPQEEPMKKPKKKKKIVYVDEESSSSEEEVIVRRKKKKPQPIIQQPPYIPPVNIPPPPAPVKPPQKTAQQIELERQKLIKETKERQRIQMIEHKKNRYMVGIFGD